MPTLETVEVPIQGMDCAECTGHVRRAIAALPGVEAVEVFLAAEKAVVRLDPSRVGLPELGLAVRQAGYSVPLQPASQAGEAFYQRFARPVLAFLGLAFGAVLFVVVAGEWLGLFAALTRRVPWAIGLVLVLAGGYPVFRNVLRAALKGQVIAHSLMTLGAIAALAVGEWATAAVVVLFMQVGDYAERFTTERARRAVKGLAALAPQTARVEQDREEIELPLEAVQPGQVVVVRPGEKVPVDGEVIAGQASVDQATLTGEAMPVEAGPGSQVYAASLVRMGSLRVRATRVGPDTTFGRVIRMVEEAEAQRARVQRLADRFSGYYLPIVAGIAGLTLLLSRDPLAAAAVLVVACSCSFALATPIAMLASIGAGARRGLLIKGGRYLEALAHADVFLIDKTGTLTLGRPRISEVVVLDGQEARDGEAEARLLQLAASAERYSEHPLAEAVRQEARRRGLPLLEPEGFAALPGLGVQAQVDGLNVMVGSRRLLAVQPDLEAVISGENGRAAALIEDLEARGRSLLYVALDGRLAGLLAACDTLRPEVPRALAELRALGIRRIELLTGDHEHSAAELARQIQEDGNLPYRAGLLPEDKIEIVRRYQAAGHTVVMVGDGVNDAPALAQADVGIALGAAGSDVAVEAAHVALLRDDWALVPQALRIARRTLRVVQANLAFTALYNLAGIGLAAFGYLPPIFAAAAQSLPDLGILANSSRLLRQK